MNFFWWNWALIVIIVELWVSLVILLLVIELKLIWRIITWRTLSYLFSYFRIFLLFVFQFDWQSLKSIQKICCPDLKWFTMIKWIHVLSHSLTLTIHLESWTCSCCWCISSIDWSLEPTDKNPKRKKKTSNKRGNTIDWMILLLHAVVAKGRKLQFVES